LAGPQRIVTLTTDFGVTDHFVGSMKGVILNINPAATIVDICNSVHSFDLLDGALTIAQAYHYFPANTIHLVVVDPGVGTARRPILVNTGKYLFVAPDNGIMSLIYEREESCVVRHITAEHYFLQPVSNTFHGRDIFAPVAGYLSKGTEPQKLGDEVTDFVRFAAPKPKTGGDKVLKGVVIKVDKFGNLITNFSAQDVPQLLKENPGPFKILVGKSEITKMRTAYAQGAPGEVFAILGSMGYLEIATNRGSAARSVGVEKGNEVAVMLGAEAANAG
jgi:S-adenosyl-L-methionine hydrolase (adenosine-forming)